MLTNLIKNTNIYSKYANYLKYNNARIKYKQIDNRSYFFSIEIQNLIICDKIIQFVQKLMAKMDGICLKDLYNHKYFLTG